MKNGKGSVGNGTSGYVTPPVGSNGKLGGFSGGAGGSASGGTSGIVTPPVGSNGKLGGGK